MGAEQRAKAGGIEDRAGADHPLGRQTRDAGRHLGHHVDRVGRDHQNGIRRRRKNLRDHGPKHGGVAVEQLEARFAGPLADPGRDDHRAGAGQVGIVAGAHPGDVRKRRGMQDVLGLGDRPLLILIDQDDLAGGAA